MYGTSYCDDMNVCLTGAASLVSLLFRKCSRLVLSGFFITALMQRRKAAESLFLLKPEFGEGWKRVGTRRLKPPPPCGLWADFFESLNWEGASEPFLSLSSPPHLHPWSSSPVNLLHFSPRLCLFTRSVLKVKVHFFDVSLCGIKCPFSNAIWSCRMCSLFGVTYKLLNCIQDWFK